MRPGSSTSESAVMDRSTQALTSVVIDNRGGPHRPVVLSGTEPEINRPRGVRRARLERVCS